MSGYLEGYGVGEEKRARRIRRALLATGIVLVVSASLYLFFRNYFEARTAELFFSLLRRRDYQAAYRLWCTDARPCPDYPMDKFLEDWGPKGSHANLSSMKIVKTRGCSTGVIFQVDFGDNAEEHLWVARKDKAIGYAPWEVCNPRLPAP